MINMINSRKNKVKNYLEYSKLIEHYSLLLEEYSKIQKTNEINIIKQMDLPNNIVLSF